MTLSIRLPETLERKLAAEAERVHKKRSELAREVIADYLHRQERDRFIAEVVSAARALANDPEARRESREVQRDFAEADAETLPREPSEDTSYWVRSMEEA